ncbi:phosphonate metabolism transcriptional regulator PhnF [Shimia biformata]|uniref:phosphonate metabolism transcriptional regulator PhnF n=1 Tax=Shimia biformata TaxID=1294299 RepID=UPI0019517C80|nr:phosphonate metabolism transcriptional regulator PhnF [Shimia biformata]
MSNRKTAAWVEIRDALTADISAGRYAEGDKLPTEATLAARFAVNRHTVRRALAEMADRGLVHARRGSGVYVTHAPTDYPIGKRVRFHQNIARTGRLASREILLLETRAADAAEAGALGLDADDKVHVCEGISMADKAVVAYFRHAFPAARLPDLPGFLRAESSITRALAGCGVADYTRASTRIDACPATAALARHMRLQDGAPLLRTTSVSVDGHGTAVEYGRTWFAADRVTLVLDQGE